MSKKSKKLTKVVNIEEENLHIFWTTKGISMKFTGKMWLMIISKVKKEGLHPFSEKHIFGKSTEGWGGGLVTLIHWSPTLFRVKDACFLRLCPV